MHDVLYHWRSQWHSGWMTTTQCVFHVTQDSTWYPTSNFLSTSVCLNGMSSRLIGSAQTGENESFFVVLLRSARHFWDYQNVLGGPKLALFLSLAEILLKLGKVFGTLCPDQRMIIMHNIRLRVQILYVIDILGRDLQSSRSECLVEISWVCM